MENASKALLIAGAILLVIAIIAIGVGILSSSKGTIGVAEGQIDSMAIQTHNSQYKMYETIVTGREVKECISKVLANNAQTNDKRMFVRVTMIGKNSANKSKYLRFGKYVNLNTGVVSEYLQELNADSSQYIDNSTRYKGKTTINKYGVIYTINFTRQS